MANRKKPTIVPNPEPEQAAPEPEPTPEEAPAPPPQTPHTIIDEIGVYANVVGQLRKEFGFKNGEAVHLITTVMNYHLTLRQMAIQQAQQGMFAPRPASPTEEEPTDGEG